MNFRPALLATAALAAAFGTFLIHSRLGAGGNRDLWAITQGVQRGEELEGHLANLRHRNEGKRALAAEVIAGRVSLGEAAGYFRGLDESDPGFVAHVQLPPRDESFYSEQVLDHVWEILAKREVFAAAARQYSEAFAADPDLLASPPARHRYLAACAAARAGCGQGRDAADLDEAGRDGWRRQALDWLRAELEARLRLLERGPQAARNTITRDLEHWLEVPHFAKVRGPDALGRLPVGERQAWQQLWADVAETLARAEGKAAPEKQPAKQ